MKLILIRHGLSTGNVLNQGKRYYIGQLDCALAEEGKVQAAALKSDPRILSADIVFASDLLRTRQTAACLTDKPVHTDARLRERSMGALEGHYREELETDPRYALYFTDPVLQRFAHDFEVKAPEGESYTDVCRRVCSFLEELRDKDYESVVVVTHFCTIRCFLHLLEDLTREETVKFSVKNGIPIEVEFDKKKKLVI